MTRLKNFLPPYILKIMYNSLVMPYLQYGILVWGSCADKLFKLQKRSVRILNNAKYNAHTDPIFKSLHLLKVLDISRLQEIKFIYKFENSMLPKYFISMFTRNSHIHSYSTRNSNHLVIPSSRHTFVKNSIRFRMPGIFNSLPISIRLKLSTHSYQGFGRYVKTFLINDYNANCQNTNCYVCSNA